MVNLVGLKKGVVCLSGMMEDPPAKTDDRMKARVDHTGQFDKKPGDDAEHQKQAKAKTLMEIHKDRRKTKSDRYPIQKQDRIAMGKTDLVHQDVMQV